MCLFTEHWYNTGVKMPRNKERAKTRRLTGNRGIRKMRRWNKKKANLDHVLCWPFLCRTRARRRCRCRSPCHARAFRPKTRTVSSGGESACRCSSDAVHTSSVNKKNVKLFLIAAKLTSPLRLYFILEIGRFHEIRDSDKQDNRDRTPSLWYNQSVDGYYNQQVFTADRITSKIKSFFFKLIRV